jgi:predicted PurR-regulated permease PerM
MPRVDAHMSSTAKHGAFEHWTGVAAIVLLVVGCLLILRPFVSAGLWAGLLCFSTWPLFERVEHALRGRRSVAALLAVLALSMLIAAPFVIVATTLVSSVSELSSAFHRILEEPPASLPAWIVGIPLIGSRLAESWNLMTQSSSARLNELLKLLPAAKTIALKGGQILGNGISEISLSLVIAFFFFRDGEALADRLTVVIGRIGGRQGEQVLATAGATIRAVVYGILGSSLLQAVLATIGFIIAGIPGAVLLGFIIFFLTLVPGGPLVLAVPAALWLYRQGSIEWAVFMVVWIAVIGALDSVIRPVLISRGGAMPLILIMFGVFGGVFAFGLIGLFIGPTLLAVGYSLFDQWIETSPALHPAFVDSTESEHSSAEPGNVPAQAAKSSAAR